MNITIIIKNNLSQIIAITEKNLSLKLRFKHTLIINFLSPIITIFMPLIIMTQFFEFNNQFGPWTPKNFYMYQFIAYNLFLLKTVINDMPNDLRYEKFWKTLPSLIIAPFNRFNLLFGIFLAYLIKISIPFTVVLIFCYLYNPISVITLIAIIGTYFLVALIFSGIGIVLSIFAISKENLWSVLSFAVEIVFLLSCITYPYQIFPKNVQTLINLNPLYYIFEFLRWIWIEDDIIFTIVYHPLTFIILIVMAIVLPCIGIYIFNIIYKKYGIVG